MGILSSWSRCSKIYARAEFNRGSGEGGGSGGENQAIDVCMDVDVTRFKDFLLSTITKKK